MYACTCIHTYIHTYIINTTEFYSLQIISPHVQAHTIKHTHLSFIFYKHTHTHTHTYIHPWTQMYGCMYVFSKQPYTHSPNYIHTHVLFIFNISLDKAARDSDPHGMYACICVCMYIHVCYLSLTYRWTKGMVGCEGLRPS
jgi:hypothetical protein